MKSKYWINRGDKTSLIPIQVDKLLNIDVINKLNK